ncbi:MAG: LysM peptidoglycan-binding domain-containing protein [Parcubacteria group bacterium]
MAKYSYVVKSGETPADVAFRYTGKGESYRDMIDLNPHIGKATASCGALVFDPKDWHEGLKVYIPARWAEGGQRFALPQTRFLGTPTGLLSDPNTDGDDQPGTGTGTRIAGTGQCNKSPVGDTKPYEITIVAGDYLDKIAKDWLGTLKQDNLGLFSVTALMRVNYDHMDFACTGLKHGTPQIRIPKDWPECPESYKNRRVKSDGTAYVDTEPPAPKPPGEDLVDRVPPGVETVGAEDDDSSTLWMLLAAGAAVAGGIYLYNAKKKGK